MTQFWQALEARIDGLVIKTYSKSETSGESDHISILLSPEQYYAIFEKMKGYEKKLQHGLDLCQPGDIIKLRFYDGVEQIGLMDNDRQILLEDRMISTEDTYSLAQDNVILLVPIMNRTGVMYNHSF